MADNYGELKYSGLSSIDFDQLIKPNGGLHTVSLGVDVTLATFDGNRASGQLNIYCGGSNPRAFLDRVKSRVNQVLFRVVAADTDRGVPRSEAKNTWKKVRTASDRNTDLRAVSGRALAR